MSKSKGKADDNVAALFRLPLAEFTSARNALAAQLKKDGRGAEATDVKALGKPSVSAWAVNQLYWNHREALDNLIASGQRFHKAQSARGGAKVADMRAALDARRDVLTQLSNAAASVLKGAGHNPSPDTLHRITTTLEGISAYASRDDGPELGRLTHDVDPPGFESVGSFVPVAGGKQKAEGKRQQAERNQRGTSEERKRDEGDKVKLAAAKASLQEAKKSWADAQTRLRSLQRAQTRAQADLRQAEERLKEATRRARSVEEDLKDAVREVAETERRVEDASRKLDAVNGK